MYGDFASFYNYFSFQPVAKPNGKAAAAPAVVKAAPIKKKKKAAPKPPTPPPVVEEESSEEESSDEEEATPAVPAPGRQRGCFVFGNLFCVWELVLWVGLDLFCGS